ncbi:MAG: APC family permease [Candidatus Obscuribacterales bacterium]|nr:APC family permease [Candidatus Obscuribacterales bacterium]
MQSALRSTAAGRSAANRESSHPLNIGSGMRVGISSFGSWMLGVGSIIGSMAWIIHGPMLAKAGPAATLSAWAIAGVLSFPLALILMELSSMFPSAGGPYVYKYYALKRLMPGMGELMGFLTGWLFWAAITVGLACMANGMVNMLASMIWSASQAPLYFGPASILALFGSATFLNFLSISAASKLNNLFTLMKFAMAGSFIALVLSSGRWHLENAFQIASPAGSTDFAANVSSVLMLAMAGFSFLEMASCTSSETVDAQKTVPKATFMTLLSVTAIYLSMCFCVSVAAPFVLSPDKSTLMIQGSSIPANCPGIAGLLGGSFIGNAFASSVVASIFACGFSAVLGIARVSFSMAETKLFPAQFAQLDPKTKVPRFALWFQFVCVCLIAITANLLARTGVMPDAYAFLGETFGFLYAFVAILYGVCVVSLRYTDPEMKRGFRIGKSGNWLVWLMALVTVSIWSYAAFICTQWTHQLTGLFVLLCGIPVYFYYKRRNAALSSDNNRRARRSAARRRGAQALMMKTKACIKQKQGE